MGLGKTVSPTNLSRRGYCCSCTSVLGFLVAIVLLVIVWMEVEQPIFSYSSGTKRMDKSDTRNVLFEHEIIPRRAKLMNTRLERIDHLIILSVHIDNDNHHSIGLCWAPKPAGTTDEEVLPLYKRGEGCGGNNSYHLFETVHGVSDAGTMEVSYTQFFRPTISTLADASHSFDSHALDKVKWQIITESHNRFTRASYTYELTIYEYDMLSVHYWFYKSIANIRYLLEDYLEIDLYQTMITTRDVVVQTIQPLFTNLANYIPTTCSAWNNNFFFRSGQKYVCEMGGSTFVYRIPLLGELFTVLQPGCRLLFSGSFIVGILFFMNIFFFPLLDAPTYGTVVGGSPSRIWSSMFAHGDYIHLGNNMVFLLIVGDEVAEMLLCNPFLFLFLYLVSGYGGAIASIGFRTLMNDNYTYSVGASGALMGLGASLNILAPYRAITMGQDAAIVRIVAELLGIHKGFTPLIFLFVQLVTDVFTSVMKGRKIDFAAHFGGGATGYIVAGLIQWYRNGL